jgi:hypothetical protein
LTVEFTKKPSFLRLDKEKGPFLAYQTRHPETFLLPLQLLDDK